jgi:hypothetical protein
MDGQRFDALVKAFSRGADRRGVVAGLLSAALATLLAAGEAEALGRDPIARRLDLRRFDNRVSGQKRKRKGKKKRRNKKKRGKDKAPACKANVCPILPGCSEQALENCSDKLFEDLLPEVESCRTACEGGDSPACRSCLDPILRAHLPEFAECAAESCTLPIPTSASGPLSDASAHHRARAQVNPAPGRRSFQRICAKSTCCTRELESCYEDTNATAIKCMGAAMVSTLIGGPIAGGAAVIICGANFAYDLVRCEDRYGCPSGNYCIEGDHCCPFGTRGCGTACCAPETTCCGGQCCAADRYCCGGTRCCPLAATVCAAGSGTEPATCCLPGNKPCHGDCCTDSPLVLCCDKSNGQTHCYAVGGGCPA